MPDTPDLADLAALIASRICHDLISPIWAISNGVELLGLEIPDRPELRLLSESAANASARIRFFRVGFGAASAQQRMSRAEVISILTDLARTGRVVCTWSSAADLHRREVRLVFLLLLCLETALTHGGKIAIRQDGATWSIIAEAARLKLDPDLWGRLTALRGIDGVAANAVQFALVLPALADLGRKLAISAEATTVSLSF